MNKDRPQFLFVWLLMLSSLVAVLTGEAAGASVSPEYFKKSVRPLLNEYCTKCHSAEKHKGDLDLEQFSSLSDARKHPKIWQSVVEQLSSGEMPPKEKPKPTSEQREQLLAWVNSLLDEIAIAQAGDPGPVVLRRLSNAEYTYTIRDITGVQALDPVREFPVDGAAGEGFMNVGNSLVMSPSLLSKYLDAGKEIASHAVLLPDGIRFSPKNTRRDWTEEILAEIRQFYRGFTDPRGGDKVNLQGIVFETNEGGRLPLEKYLHATLELRDGLNSGKTAESIAHERGLSPKYLRTLYAVLTSAEPSLLIEPIRARWRATKQSDAATLVPEIAQWQKALWKFSSVGHIGKVGGPKAWMEPVSPVAAKQELRLKIPVSADAKEVTLYLVASDAGDGNEHDFVVWQRPRLVAPGRPDLLLRDIREIARDLNERRESIFSNTAKLLAAAAEAGAGAGKTDLEALALNHHVELDALRAWLDYLGIGPSESVKIDSYFTNTVKSASNYDFIKGWHNAELPNLLANSSDQHVRIPGNMKPHSIAVHPNPKLQAVVGWRSPVTDTFRVDAFVQHAHPECGNGITWSLELRHGTTRKRLASGVAQGAKEIKVPAIESVALKEGDLISMLIGPRDGNHSCDLTCIDLTLTSRSQGGRVWNLAQDVSPDVLAGNPHADRFGNAGVWHFYTEPDKGGSENGPVIPAGSLLAKWEASTNSEEKQSIADQIQNLLTSKRPTAKDSPDAKLYQQLTAINGPLFRGLLQRNNSKLQKLPASAVAEKSTGPAWSLNPALFGKHPDGRSIESASLCVHAPAVYEIRLPADLVAGCEFVTTGVLEKESGAEGSVQLLLLTNKPSANFRLLASSATVQNDKGTWTDPDKPVSYAAPIVVNEGSAARQRVEAAFNKFRDIFPAALCYTKIVPVDEVVTLTLFYREDHQLERLMLDDGQTAKLNRLWDELHFVSQDALTLVDAFEQLWQFATQDADPKVFEPLREPIKQRAAAFRTLLTNSQPRQVESVLDFADLAYRHPLTKSEKNELRALYQGLRAQELPHDEAIRMTLARVLVAPAFLYHAEQPGSGAQASRVSDFELANRLSYFLWSSAPDAELRELAARGKLRNPDVLVAQARRLLGDARVRRLATEFGCAWLHIYDFDELGEKSDKQFPTFTSLRGSMYEESIRFFTDLFQNDRSVQNILKADYTFVNEPLARHYGISGLKFSSSNEWQRVSAVQKFGRGGILGQATTLAKQSGASRTSPILRGNWINEVLLGERLPRPPKDVPRLPEDEATETLTVRQLTEKHSSDPRCAGCHVRIDAFGFALEKFDAIGRRRERDLGDRPINVHAKVFGGAEFNDIDGLREYLLTKRGDAFLKQFCRKLLGYALGRAVQLSDGPLISEMRAQLKANDYRISAAIESIVRSKQFTHIRGREMAYED
ncbi:MAG TPA: DUF1592 domain-containing protein [Verrucomicrobiae bacterium]